MSIVKQYREIVLGLAVLPKRKAVTLLKDSSDDVHKALCEIAFNVVHGNIDLNNLQVQKLRKFRAFYKRLAEKRSTKTEIIKNIAAIQLLITFARDIISKL